MFSYNHLELSSQILLSIYVAALKIYPSHPQQVLITDPSCSSLTLTTTSVPWPHFPGAVPSQRLSEQGYMETRLFLQHLWLEDSLHCTLGLPVILLSPFQGQIHKIVHSSLSLFTSLPISPTSNFQINQLHCFSETKTPYSLLSQRSSEEDRKQNNQIK